MLCYKDMTFCTYNKCVNFKRCFRAFTKERESGADSTDLPVCFFADKPECFKETKEGTKK